MCGLPQSSWISGTHFAFTQPSPLAIPAQDTSRTMKSPNFNHFLWSVVIGGGESASRRSPKLSHRYRKILRWGRYEPKLSPFFQISMQPTNAENKRNRTSEMCERSQNAYFDGITRWASIAHTTIWVKFMFSSVNSAIHICITTFHQGQPRDGKVYELPETSVGVEILVNDYPDCNYLHDIVSLSIAQFQPESPRHASQW